MDIVHDITFRKKNKRYKEKSNFNKLLYNLIYKFMGQHTWFYKSKDLYYKVEYLYSKLDEFEESLIDLSDDELNNIWNEINQIEDINSTEFHDCFRTSKRNIDRSYILDVISSKEECYYWIEKNKEHVYNLNEEYLNQFWEEYPDGIIDFG
jgi:hypothetical protein